MLACSLIRLWDVFKKFASMAGDLSLLPFLCVWVPWSESESESFYFRGQALLDSLTRFVGVPGHPEDFLSP